MSWWQWGLIAWLGAGPLGLLILAVMDWWYGRALDREWKRFDRQRELAHHDVGEPYR